MTLKSFAGKLIREESGQDLLEYALVLATVLAAIVTGSNAIAAQIATGLATISTRILASVT
jgi:Flp pilus assembly pilin Flp